MYGAEQVIWTGLEDRDGDLWIGGLSLCRILSGNTCDRTGLPDELTASTTPVSPQVRKVRLLMQDATGTVWIGGDAGLYRHRDGRSQRVEKLAGERTGWLGTAGRKHLVWCLCRRALPVARRSPPESRR